MTEPLWRQFLCWGAVVTFLSLPLIVFVMAIASREFGWTHFTEHLQEYKWLAGYYQSVTALTFGLAGLNTLDRHIERKNGGSYDSAGNHNQNSKP